MFQTDPQKKITPIAALSLKFGFYNRKRIMHDFWKNMVEFEPVYAESINPEAYLKLDYEAIIHLIKKLPKGAREVFNLYIIDGYDHNEIAVMLDISAATSRSQLTRARKWLREQLIQEKKNFKLCG